MLYPDLNELISYKNLKFSSLQPSRHLSRSAVAGIHYSHFRGRGLEFESVRKYVPGDDIRNLDWRVTARTGLPHLKIFQQERQRRIVLCVDMNAAMRFGTRCTFKSVQAARVAALLGWQSIARSDRVSACLFGDVPGGIELFKSKNNQTPFSRVLKRLSEPSIESADISMENAFRYLAQTTQAGSFVYFISDFMSIGPIHEVEEALERLRKRNSVIFISINDPADQSLFPVGILGFQGVNREKMWVDTDNLAGRKAYTSQWELNRKSLRDLVDRYQIPLIELTTESEVKKDLFFFLKAIERRKTR